MSAPPLLDVDRLLRTLAEFGVDFVVIGGVAGVVHGHERTTFDLDICYSRAQQSTRALARALTALDAYLKEGDRLIPAPADFRIYQHGDTFILRTDAGDLDCLAAPDGTTGYEDLARGAVSLSYVGVDFLVASLDDLIRMKRASGQKKHRSKDREDHKALRRIRRELANHVELEARPEVGDRVYIGAYWRPDGTLVKGHWRRKAKRKH